jgi:hypothetical protein
MPRLDIPYRSQWAADADRHSADCGPTCAAMIMNYNQIEMTPNRIYDFLPSKEPGAFTFWHELTGVLQNHQIPAQRHTYVSRFQAMDNVRANIDAGNPMIALVKYEPWIQATGNNFEWGHFVVITGYDNANVYMHDPLFGGPWRPASAGAHFAMSHDLFCAGWGGFPATENPNFSCCVAPSKTAVSQPIPAAPSPPPSPPPPAAPPTGTTDDVNRRIRALAAYRWAEPPDFTNTEAVKFWTDHLGDFGLHYDRYKVKPGDTLSGLASRFYGQQNRWQTIQAYNDLHRDGLWVDETLLIPRLGQSGAHLNPALPSDTPGFAKAIDLDDLVDPDLAAWDYNELGRNSVGIGFDE